MSPFEEHSPLAKNDSRDDQQTEDLDHRAKRAGGEAVVDDAAATSVKAEANDAQKASKPASPLARSGQQDLPASVGPYPVEGRLGRGGMADVLAVRDHRFDRLLALKRLEPFPSTSFHQELFVSEMQVTASLEHPHIVPILDRGTEADGRPFYLMPVLRGANLRQTLKGNQAHLALTDLLAVFQKVAAAVEHAHRRGVLHLDLKPSNIFWGELDSVYVIDWGIARPIEGPEGRAEVRLGTPSYMAPEQFNPSLGEIGPRSNVYGLGALLFNMATRRRPPQRDLSSREKAEQLGDDVPVRLRETIGRAMAPAQQDRQASVAELSDDVRRYLHGAPYVMLIHREIRLGSETAFEAWAHDLSERLDSSFPGHQSITHVRLSRATQERPTTSYLMIGRFVSKEHAEAFDSSDLRKGFLDRAEREGFSASVERIDGEGKEAWLFLEN